MRFLLVQPPTILEVARRLRQFVHLEPLALEIVAGGIPAGHETRILDLASSQKPQHEFAARLEALRPDVVGFTGYSNQARAVKELAALAKRLLPGCTVIVGGCHATIAPHDFKLPGVIDLVVRGEGGSVMPALVSKLERGDGLPEGSPFLPTRSAAFEGLAAGRPPELPPYEQVPAPRRDLVDRSQYFSVWHGERREKLRTLFPRTAALRTSVGCTNRCTFCVVHYLANGKYRQRNPQDVVEEIASVPEDHIYFVDDEMFLNARRCEAIARLLIERGVRKKYISWARADTICGEPDLFRLWKEAGLSLLYVGLESMQAETLRDYNKGVDPDTNRRAVRILHGLGIGLHASFMARPDFTREDFVKAREAIDLVSPAEVSFTVFSPPPGTPLWEKHREEFICPDPYSFYDCMHTLLPTRMPLKEFYKQFALLYLIGTRENPWRCNRVRVPLADLARFFWRGITYGLALKGIWRDYEGLDGEAS